MPVMPPPPPPVAPRPPTLDAFGRQKPPGPTDSFKNGRRRRPRGRFVAKLVDAIRVRRGPAGTKSEAAIAAVTEAAVRCLRDFPDVTERDKAAAIPLAVAAYFVPTATELEARAVLDGAGLKAIRQGLDKPA